MSSEVAKTVFLPYFPHLGLSKIFKNKTFEFVCFLDRLVDGSLRKKSDLSKIRKHYATLQKPKTKRRETKNTKCMVANLILSSLKGDIVCPKDGFVYRRL